MKKLHVLLAVVLSCLVLSGCGGNGPRNTSEEPTLPSYEKSEAIAADIYIDGTTSMYGYVNYPGGTIYADAIKNSDRVLTENWKKADTEYIKFGDSFKKMSRDEFLQMNQAGFYDQKDTSLQKVVEQADNKKLNIVITDLFQTNQDIDSLMASLKTKGLSGDNAVAVVGLKSQFNGKIFDIGKNLSSVDYASTDDPQTYRPFYLLIFGPSNDVRSFTQAYVKNAPANSQVRASFIGKNLGSQGTLEADSVSKGEKREKGVAPLAEISNILPSDTFKQFRLKNDEKASTTDLRLFNKDVIGKIPTAYELQLDKVEMLTANADGADQKPSFLDKILRRTAKGDSAFTEVDAKDFLTGTVNDVGLKNGESNIAFTINVNPGAVHKKDGVYRAAFAIVPTKDAYVESLGTFDDWNFDDSQVSADPAALSQVGNKTLHISQFIKQLGSMNYELNDPGFHDLYIFFEAK